MKDWLWLRSKYIVVGFSVRIRSSFQFDISLQHQFYLSVFHPLIHSLHSLISRRFSTFLISILQVNFAHTSITDILYSSINHHVHQQPHPPRSFSRNPHRRPRKSHRGQVSAHIHHLLETKQNTNISKRRCRRQRHSSRHQRRCRRPLRQKLRHRTRHHRLQRQREQTPNRRLGENRRIRPNKGLHAESCNGTVW